MRRHVWLSGSILEVGGITHDLDSVDALCILGAGKASAAMASTLESILGSRVSAGCVVTKYGHSRPCQYTKILEAGHPVVDENGLRATNEILTLAQGLSERDFAIVLISGGASALLERFPESIPLADAQGTFELLLRSGATIREMNAVRKHISLVKGGQLSRAMQPCPSITLLISDVIGDALDVIGSGPTVPDPTTFESAWTVLEQYELVSRIPNSVRTYLRLGLSGQIPETPKTADSAFTHAQHRVVASNQIALAAAAEAATANGLEARIVTSAIAGEARDVASIVCREIRSIAAEGRRRVCLLYGGEMTVTVRGDGTGGRCQEFIVAALEQMRDFPGEFALAAVGTDGTDGPTDAAGGIIGHDTFTRLDRASMSITQCLERNDAYQYLKSIDALVMTGPTGTNVMDILVAVLP